MEAVAITAIVVVGLIVVAYILRDAFRPNRGPGKARRAKMKAGRKH